MIPARFVVAFIALMAPLSALAQDNWVGAYKNANSQLAAPAAGEKRVIFYGDSITQMWVGDKVTFFPGKGYIGRGISGQTTTQMLVRFRQDVIRLHPAVVVILAGTNDIAGNIGPTSPQLIEDNLQSMAELATANGIKPLLCSILPVFDYPWKKGLNPADKIVALNAWIENYCTQNHLIYVNYYPAVVSDQKGMQAKYSKDGVHPNSDGFAVMAPIAQDAIDKALQAP